jgi:hypothetical protein
VVDGRKNVDILTLPFHTPLTVLIIPPLIVSKLKPSSPIIDDAGLDEFVDTESKLQPAPKVVPVIEKISNHVENAPEPEPEQASELIPESSTVAGPIFDVIPDCAVPLPSENDALQEEQELPKPTLAVDEALPNDAAPDDDLRLESVGDVLQQEQGLIPEPIPVVDEAPPSVAPALVEYAREPELEPFMAASTSGMIGETILEDAFQQEPTLSFDETIPKDATPDDASTALGDMPSVAADPTPEPTPEPPSNPSLPISITVGDSASDDGKAEYTRRRVRRCVKRERRALREQAALLSSMNTAQVTFQPDLQSSARVPVVSTSIVRPGPVHNTQHRHDDVAPALFEITPLIVDETNALQQEPGLILEPVLAVDGAIFPTSTDPDGACSPSGDASPVVADLMLELAPECFSNLSPPASPVSTTSAMGESSSEDGHGHAPRPRRWVRRSVQRERRALREEAARPADTPTPPPHHRSFQPNPWSSIRLVPQAYWNRSASVGPDPERSTRYLHSPYSPSESMPVASSSMAQGTTEHLSREDCDGWQLVCRRRR